MGIKLNTDSLIPLLWITFSLLLPNIAHATWDYKNVMGASECGECHEDEMDVWKKTAHQKNFKALSKNKDAKKIAKKMGIKSIKKDNAICSSCHYTVGHKKEKAKIVAGVSCESCHSPAKEWIDIHNDYGGKGINKKSESASHKKTRYKKLESLNMIRPDNTYGWAKNCLNCHIVANEKLVNTGGHEAGSDFKLSKRTQGKIRHYPKANVDTLHYYNLVSFATELEVSLTALADAKGGKYATEMQKRATLSLENLKSANSTTPNKHAKNIISLASNANIKTGNKQLSNVAKSISVSIMQMVQQETGYAYDSKKLKQTTQNIAKKKAPAPITKPRPVVKAKPLPVAKAKPQPKAEPKPKPKKQDKQTAETTTTPINKPNLKTSITDSLESPVATIKPTTSNNQLLESFDVIVPGNVALCETYTPWALGKHKLNNNTYLTQGGCFAIDVKAGRTAQLYIFTESPNNNLLRLVPNNCDYLGVNFNALSANKLVNIPKPGHSSSAINLNELHDYKKLYIIIADNAYANGEMSRLSANTPSICDANIASTETNISQSLADMLSAIKTSADDHIDWKMQKLQ